jgi:hypothetical protein
MGHFRPGRAGITSGHVRHAAKSGSKFESNSSTDNRLCSVLLSASLPQTTLLADRGYEAVKERSPAGGIDEHFAETKSRSANADCGASLSSLQTDLPDGRLFRFSCPALLRKIFRFAPDPNQPY